MKPEVGSLAAIPEGLCGSQNVLPLGELRSAMAVALVEKFNDVAGRFAPARRGFPRNAADCVGLI